MESLREPLARGVAALGTWEETLRQMERKLEMEILEVGSLAVKSPDTERDITSPKQRKPETRGNGAPDKWKGARGI